MTKVTVKDVALKRKNTQILKDINIHLSIGNVYGLVGRNGAGKSTVMSLIASYIKPTQGEVLLDEYPVYEIPHQMEEIIYCYNRKNEQVARQIVHHFELLNAYMPLFNVDYGLKLLKDYGIQSHQLVNRLSEKESAALSAIIGLASMKRVVLLDEIQNMMDREYRSIFYTHIENMKDKTSRIVVISTHLVNEMEHLFDEFIILYEGRLVLQEPIDTLRARGFTITGTLNNVLQVVKGKTVIQEEHLGEVRSVSMLGALTPEDKAYISKHKVYYAPIQLQDLVIYLTKPKGDIE